MTGRTWVVACLAMLAVACGGQVASAPEPSASAGLGPPFVVPTPPPHAPVTDRCPLEPPRPAVVDPGDLSLVERAGLLVAVGIPGATHAADPEAVAAVDAGVGGVVLKTENIQTLEQVRTLVDDLSRTAPLGLLVFVDQEGGRVAHARAVVEETVSARRLGQSAVEDPAGSDAHAAGETIGVGLRAAGIHAALAPVADLDDGPWDGIIGDRSFGATAEVAAAAAVAFTRGLHARGTLAVAKHFPGHAGAGDTHGGGEQSDLSRTALDEHVAVFEELVDAGVDAVMVGHVAYAAFGSVPASVDPRVYGALRDMGFEGVAITDSLGMGAVHQGRGHGGAAVEALRAGADLLLANQGSDAAVAMRDAIVDAVRDGTLDPARVDEAARRVMLLRARQAVAASGCR